MSIGLGIALVVLGAIFAFAVEVPIPGLDGHALGWILMLGGAIALVLSAVQANMSRKRTVVSRTEDEAGRAQVRERQVEEDRPTTM